MIRIPTFLLFALATPAAWAQPGSIARGELLYSTHCNACHNEQMHWRDKKAVTGWPSLLTEVRRWQTNAGRSWDKGDTEAMACYLNSRFYHLVPGRGVCIR